MARQFYRYPPRPSSGSGTFSDNLVGLQIVDGGGLTQGNFEFTTRIVERNKRNFITGVFSDPISLETLGLDSIEESKMIQSKELQVYPNFDLSQITSFSLFGSLKKRLEVSITNIINNFPAALEVNFINSDFTQSDTAINIIYDKDENVTTFDINVNKIKNPFDIDYTRNADFNLNNREIKVSHLRNLKDNYQNYVVVINNISYEILLFTPSSSLFNGMISLVIEGNPFSGDSVSQQTIIIRPDNFVVDRLFSEYFDEVEKFLLNRNTAPIYTAKFSYPELLDNGTTAEVTKTITWPLDGSWNLDILSESFDNYLLTLNEIADEFDSYTTNLISRFLVSESFNEFDTDDHRVNKLLNVYGRSFDEVKKFIDGLAHITSVNYIVKDDIPSALLKNLALTLGWKTNISPISKSEFLDSIFNTSISSSYPGITNSLTPNQLNYQFYRNLILNSAYLFKSKGTRKSVEGLLRLIGAPDALIEFNEYVYTTTGKLNMSSLNRKYSKISGGTYIDETVEFDPQNVYKFQGIQYSGYLTNIDVINVELSISDYPVDSEGYPKSTQNNDDFFFQKGSGWYELTKTHQSPTQINVGESVFTGDNLSIITNFEEFTYGQKYLERYSNFPFMNGLGFQISKTIDNKKSWDVSELNRYNNSAGFNSAYSTPNDKNVINVKNIDLYLSPAKGLLYDVYSMSINNNYPIPTTGLSNNQLSGNKLDNTKIGINPTKVSFFEFSQTFIKNMINVKNRQFSSDGKTSGYPTLQSLYWKYLQSEQAIGIPNDNFTYESMTDYVNGIGDYWIKLVEQMIPATTLFEGGNRIENSIFHRQKFVYRLQRGCQLVPVPCDPCEINTSIFKYDCVTERVECEIFPFGGNVNNFGDVLYQTLINYLNSNDKDLSECDINTLVTDWYVDLRVGDDVLVNYNFFSGVGLNEYPSDSEWVDAINISLNDIYNYGFRYTLDTKTSGTTSDDVLIFESNLCGENNINKLFRLNVGIDFNISCN